MIIRRIPRRKTLPQAKRSQLSRAELKTNKQINDTTLFHLDETTGGGGSGSGGDNSWMQWAAV